MTAVAAALVSVAALVTVTVLRVQRGTAGDEPKLSAPTTTTPDAAATCGDRPCEVLTSVPVGGMTVELLADISGRNGRLRVLGHEEPTVLETALAGMGVKLTQKSLVCFKGPASACVVRGGHDGGMVGEVFVSRGKQWQAAAKPYFSTAGYLDLVQVVGNKSAEVAVAEQPGCDGPAAQCAGSPIVVRVFGLDGDTAGCTPQYASLTQLPGWPDVELTEPLLQKCQG